MPGGPDCGGSGVLGPASARDDGGEVLAIRNVESVDRMCSATHVDAFVVGRGGAGIHLNGVVIHHNWTE